MRRLSKLALVPLAVALVIGGCGDDDDDDAATDPVDTTAVATSAPATTTSPPSGASTTSELAGPTTTAALAEFPPELTDLEQGGVVWAVVLGGATAADAPEITAAVDAAESAGYDAGPTDCDEGAAEALGVDGGGTTVLTVSVYFETQEHADDALAAFLAQGYDGGVVAEVRTFCAD